MVFSSLIIQYLVTEDCLQNSKFVLSIISLGLKRTVVNYASETLKKAQKRYEFPLIIFLSPVPINQLNDASADLFSHILLIFMLQW